MSFHVTCPLSRKRFYFDRITDARVFIAKIFDRAPKYTSRIRVYDGKEMVGSAWKAYGKGWGQSRGVRAKRIVNHNGTLRREEICRTPYRIPGKPTIRGIPPRGMPRGA